MEIHKRRFRSWAIVLLAVASIVTEEYELE